MTDFSGLLQQAKKMQEQMQKAQEELARMEVTGEAGAGLVKVTINGKHEVKKVAENSKGQLSGITAGLNLPDGFKLPF